MTRPVRKLQGINGPIDMRQRISGPSGSDILVSVKVADNGRISMVFDRPIKALEMSPEQSRLAADALCNAAEKGDGVHSHVTRILAGR